MNLSDVEIAGAVFLEEVRSKIVQAFVTRRNDCGLRQSHIAEKLGVNRSVVHRELTGDKNLSVIRVGEIADAMGYSIHFQLTPKEQFDVGNHPPAMVVPGPATRGAAVYQLTPPPAPFVTSTAPLSAGARANASKVQANA